MRLQRLRRLQRIRRMGTSQGTPTPPPPGDDNLILKNDIGDVILVNGSGVALAWR